MAGLRKIQNSLFSKKSMNTLTNEHMNYIFIDKFRVVQLYN